MDNINLNLWDREFNLEVVYDQYEGEEILLNQEDALNKFIELINTKQEKNIQEETKQEEAKQRKNILEEAKQGIIKYIFEEDKDKLEEEEITNIFKYIIPTALYIERTEDKRIVDLMCEYKFDIEHGLAIQFENEQFKMVVKQDYVL